MLMTSSSSAGDLKRMKYQVIIRGQVTIKMCMVRNEISVKYEFEENHK